MSGVLARPWGRATALVAVLIFAGLAVWWFGVHRSVGSSTVQRKSASTKVNATTLRALVAAIRRPVYWVGPRRGVTYEFTETSDRRIYIRYLPSGVAAGSAHPYLTVGSYPVVNAFAVTRAAAARRDAVALTVPGGVGFYPKTKPTDAWIAFPASDTQIELYDPSGRALKRVVAAGRIQLVGGSAAALPARTSAAALHALSAKLHQPIYWVGALPGRTLELTRATDGRIDLRYLPRGVAPGSPRTYLAVGTYPLAQAYRTTLAAAKKTGAVRIPLTNGAVAFYAKTRPTNVYVAFPGVNEQVEIYDPSARAAHQLIAAGELAPVP